MKKLLILIITITFVMTLSACDDNIEVYDDTNLQEQIDALIVENESLASQLELLENYNDTEVLAELVALQTLIDNIQGYNDSDLLLQISDIEDRLDELDLTILQLEEILVNIEVIEGLNGQKEYYIPNDILLTPQTMSANVMGIEVLGDELNKDKAPSYVLDANGNYLQYQTVVHRLLNKYYGAYTLYDAKLGFQVGFSIDVTLSKEEFVARSILLIEEISNYDFYIISSSQLYIQVNCFGGTSAIIIPIATLRSSFITLNAEVMIAGLYEITYFNLYFDNTLVQELYDGYVLSGAYDGYVLDFN